MRLIERSKSVIVSLDVILGSHIFRLVKQTCGVPEVGAYKIGAAAALHHGLTTVVSVVRQKSDLPIIYDHQKAGTDTPYTAGSFMRAVSGAGVDAVILFPFAGPETARAWINEALNHEVEPIVGSVMTHPMFLDTYGGLICENRILEPIRLALDLGVRNFVVPGTRVVPAKLIRDTVTKVTDEVDFFAPGFGPQGGALKDFAREFFLRNFHPIIGRRIAGSDDPEGEASKVAKEMLIRK